MCTPILVGVLGLINRLPQNVVRIQFLYSLVGAFSLNLDLNSHFPTSNIFF